MKIELWVIGKTNFPYLQEGLNLYEKRLRRYLSFTAEIIPDVKNAGGLSPDLLKQKEAEAVLKKLEPADFLVVLDEKGQQKSSVEFAAWLESVFSKSHKKIVFLIGGAYGFDTSISERANAKLSLSKMTFSHQMARLFFVEQLYRAMTILKNEPYHNE